MPKIQTSGGRNGLRTRDGSARAHRGRAKGAHHAAGAFSLVEVLISIFIFSIVFIGFYLNLKQGFSTTELSRENLRATQILEQQMEIIRLYTWDQINSNGFVPTSFTVPLDPSGTTSNGLLFTANVVITNASMSETYSSDFVMVTTTLTWTSASRVSHSRTMSTLVSQYGLHNYFY